MAIPSVELKLVINTEEKRVLFAETGKDCVDFLFYILSLPVATVVGLISREQSLGSLRNIFESLETLNESYIQPNQNKNLILHPPCPSSIPPPGSSIDGGGGLVKGMVTYMVMDDLVVKPLSTISSIGLLNSFQIKDVGLLEERVVTLGSDEALKMLAAMLKSTTVLTDVFLN